MPAQLSAAGSLSGDEVGSRDIVFQPGRSRKGGVYRFDIGTAGSATMLAFPLLPLALYAETPSRFTLTGGLFQDFAPSAFHMRDVLFPHLESMGARIQLKIERPGYVPKGGGRLTLEVEPIRRKLEPLTRLQQGSPPAVPGNFACLQPVGRKGQREDGGTLPRASGGQCTC